MNKKQTTNRQRFSPKVIAVISVAAIAVILCGIFLFRSALTGNVLDSIDAGDFRFDLCGNGSLSQIVVYKDGDKTATVKTSAVGNADDHYGVTVADLNFDGSPDLLVAQTSDGKDKLYAAWVWNRATGTYKSADAAAGAPNVTVNEDYECLVSFGKERRSAGEDADGVAYYEEAQVYRIFREVKGEMVEFARYELVYYTKNDIYAYRVFRFDKNDNALSSFSEDSWLDPAEAETLELAAEMASDMEAHRTDYFPEEAEESTDGDLTGGSPSGTAE